MAFNLASIKSGPSEYPPRIVIYGQHGLGKTTFAAGARNPIFIQTEDGLNGQSVARFPLATRYEDLIEAISTLHDEEHDFETVVLDSADWTEKLIFQKIARDENVKDISDIGYGKGYEAATGLFYRLFEGLNALRLNRKMMVIVTAHAAQKNYKDPLGADYIQHTIALHKKSAPQLLEWADIVGFCDHDKHISLQDDGFNKTTGKARTIGRVVHFEPNASFAAKNRYQLPARLPLSYAAFADALGAAINNQN